MSEQEIVLAYLEKLKEDITKKIEEVVSAKIVYWHPDGMTIKVLEKSGDKTKTLNYIFTFKSKKIEIKGTYGSVGYSFNHITKAKEKYLISLYQQHKSINHTMNLCKK